MFSSDSSRERDVAVHREDRHIDEGDRGIRHGGCQDQYKRGDQAMNAYTPAPALGLRRLQLERRVATPLGAEPLHVLQRRRRRVFLCVRILDRALHAIASYERGSHRNLWRRFREAYGAFLLPGKHAMPARGLHVPGSNVNAAADHDDPDRDEPMIVAGTDPHVLAGPKRGHNIVTECLHGEGV